MKSCIMFESWTSQLQFQNNKRSLLIAFKSDTCFLIQSPTLANLENQKPQVVMIIYLYYNNQPHFDYVF